jgi:hypothetical protein
LRELKLTDATTPTSTASRSATRLLPISFNTAFSTYWATNKLDALIFLVANLVIGTLGLWLPLVNAFMTGQQVVAELTKNLDGGQFYIYAITFSAANGGIVFLSLLKNRVEQAIQTRVILIGFIVFMLFIGSLLLQAELMRGMIDSVGFLSSHTVNWGIQLVWSGEAILLAIYTYSFLVIEESGNPKADVDNGASALAELQRQQSQGGARFSDWKTTK